MGNVKKKQVFQRKLTRKMISIGILGAVWGFCAFLFFNERVQSKEKGEIAIQEMRLKCAEIVAQVEAGNLERLIETEGYIVDSEGNVTVSFAKDYQEGEKINWHSLSSKGEGTKEFQIQTYISPLQKEGIFTGMLVLEKPAAIIRGEHNDKKEFSLILEIGGMVISLIIMAWQTQTVKKMVTVPLDLMQQSVEQGLIQKAEVPIAYSKQDELGRLARGIEALEQEIVYSYQEAKKLYEKEKMLTGYISHDLKTPVATILGYAEGIRDGIAKTPEVLQKYIEIIIQKANLLNQLIGEILEHTKVQVDETIIKKEEVYARAYFTEIIGALRPDIEKKGLLLEVGTIPDVMIELAPNEIYKVCQNIIGNSIKYTPYGGKVIVQFETSKEWFSVIISDNGQGIAAMDLPFVFDAFYRGEKARTQTEISGSGLGLCIVKSIVEKHGGSVECESIQGEGTTVGFSLPLDANYKK